MNNMIEIGNWIKLGVINDKFVCVEYLLFGIEDKSFMNWLNFSNFVSKLFVFLCIFLLLLIIDLILLFLYLV